MIVGVEVSEWMGLNGTVCATLLEQIRWPRGLRCTRCRNGNVERLRATRPTSSTRVSYRCTDCEIEYKVVGGTPFEPANIPISKWFAATALSCFEGGHVSAKRLQRELKVGAMSARIMAEGIRCALAADPDFCWQVAGACSEMVHGKSVSKRRAEAWAPRFDDQL